MVNSPTNHSNGHSIIDDQLRHFVNQLADKSGAVIRDYFRKAPDMDIKADASPVTIADQQAEQALRDLITEHYPEHGIIGEEFPPHNEHADYVWILDPIDGTKSFIAGKPTFGTLIALTYQRKPLLGMLDQPIARERWLGIIGQDASFNGTAIQTSAKTELSQALIATTGPSYFKDADYQTYQQIVEQCRYPLWGGDCYNYGLVALGTVDLVIETELKPHDYMALAALVIAAGGVFTDWDGNEVSLDSDGKVIAAANQTLLTKVLDIINQ